MNFLVYIRIKMSRNLIFSTVTSEESSDARKKESFTQNKVKAAKQIEIILFEQYRMFSNI